MRRHVEGTVWKNLIMTMITLILPIEFEEDVGGVSLAELADRAVLHCVCHHRSSEA